VVVLSKANEKMSSTIEYAPFGAGCFWCTEAVFKELKGVKRVSPGFSGGRVKNPSYREVVHGGTGHAEVAQIAFDPTIISYGELLEVFWLSHDPTTLNRQGNDVGEHYRSAILYHTEAQKEEANSQKTILTDAKAFQSPIVTEIKAFEVFYPADNYHKDYYELNPNQGYCRVVIAPKVEKVRRVFKDRLK